METRHCTFCSSCAFIGTIHTPHFLSLCVSFSALPTTWLYWRWIFFLSCHITLGSLYWIIRNRNYEFEIRYYQLLLFSFAAMLLLLLLLLLFEFLYVCIFSYTLYPCCLCHYYTRFNRCRAAHVIKMFQFFFRSLACHRRRCRQWWWWCCCCCLGYCLQLQHLCMIMDFCMTFHFDSFHGTSSVSIFSFFGLFFARYILLNAPNALDTVAFFSRFCCCCRWIMHMLHYEVAQTLLNNNRCGKNVTTILQCMDEPEWSSWVATKDTNWKYKVSFSMGFMIVIIFEKKLVGCSFASTKKSFENSLVNGTISMREN